MNVRSFYRMLADSPSQWILTHPEEAAPRTGDGLFPEDVVEIVQVFLTKQPWLSPRILRVPRVLIFCSGDTHSLSYGGMLQVHPSTCCRLKEIHFEDWVVGAFVTAHAVADVSDRSLQPLRVGFSADSVNLKVLLPTR